MQGGIVHDKLVPILERRLPPKQVWAVLRFAGSICDDDGTPVGIASAIEDFRVVREQMRMEVIRFTGPGVHDEQLTPKEFFAWRRTEYAARLEYMAEARGRPRPGTAHPEAEADDPDGVHGGERPDDAEFEREDARPGGDADVADADGVGAQVDPELTYVARHLVAEDEVFDVVHRHDEAEKQRRNLRSQKQDLFEKFLREHQASYQEARTPRCVVPIAPGPSASVEVSSDRAAAMRQQTSS